jgi:hypothetical protein
MKTIEVKESKPNLILENKLFAWILITISFILMLIDNFFKMDKLIGGWHIVLYLLLIAPLAILIWKNRLKNRYVKWFFPILLIMIVDMFYYSNEMVQWVVPIIFYIIVISLYLTSMHNLHSFYQTLIPNFNLSFKGLDYLKEFFLNLFIKNDDKQIYARIGLALLITLPFLGIFVALLFSADTNFGNFLKNMIDFNFKFHPKYIWTLPWSFFLYLLLFVYAFSNSKNRTTQKETASFDMLIVGIFLGMITLLFSLFIIIQLPFLFGGNYLPQNEDLATFARQGFFQLMMVMGLVMLIFLFIMRRFKGEKITIFLLSFLLIETIVMGLISLKKMYLYQSIKGATVLRYYVEWFDYFLISVLALGLYFLIKKLHFSKLLDVVALLALFSFSIIISTNIDSMVASHNIEKFEKNPKALDKNALRKLSIDALGVIEKHKISMPEKTYYKQETQAYLPLPWYTELKRKECHSFATYHYGYCSTVKKYKGALNVQK